jgi:hypothetical protein
VGGGEEWEEDIIRRKRGGSKCIFKRKRGEREGVRGVAENRIKDEMEKREKVKLNRKEWKTRVKMKGENIEEKNLEQGEEAKRRKGWRGGMERRGNKE